MTPDIDGAKHIIPANITENAAAKRINQPKTHQNKTDKTSNIMAIGYRIAAVEYAHLLNWHKTTKPMPMAMRDASHCPVGSSADGGGRTGNIDYNLGRNQKLETSANSEMRVCGVVWEEGDGKNTNALNIVSGSLALGGVDTTGFSPHRR